MILFQQLEAIPWRVEGELPREQRGSEGHDFLQTVKFSQIRQADRRAKAGHSLDTRGREHR